MSQSNDTKQFHVGPLESLLQDGDIMEIMINRFDDIYYEKYGKLIKSEVQFESEGHLLQTVRGILNAYGREVTETNPIVDLRMSDGTLMNVVIPPIAVDGTIVTLRKFWQQHLTFDDLLRFGSISGKIKDFLEACIKSRLNIILAGGTGSGKTTVLNLLSSFIGDEERVVVVEGLPSVNLLNKHIVRMSSRPANIDGEGEITLRNLLINALKMRPDRIILGEVQGGEALDMIQAMNTGHDGSMFSIHANTPRDALMRLEVMAMMAGPEMPILSIREQIANAIGFIIQQTRLKDGSRKITHVTEIMGMEGNMITMRDIFEFVETRFEDDKVIGHFTPTGIIPKSIHQLRDMGFDLSDNFFLPEIN